MKLEIIEIDTKEKREQAFAIRRKVFIEEQLVSEQEEYDEFETSSRHFLCSVNEKPVGTARLRKTNYGCKLERICILKEFRNQNIGRKLVIELLQKAKQQNCTFIYLHAQTSVQEFYRKLGFLPEGEVFLEADIEHIKMFLGPESMARM